VMEKPVVTLEEHHMPHLAMLFDRVYGIAWAGEKDKKGRLGLAHQVIVDTDMLVDLRCALTAIGLGRPE